MCRKLAGADALPAWEVVWRFPHGIAFLGPWQFYHGYCMLVSRTHASELSQLPDAERQAHLNEMTVLARAIEAAFQPHKMNYELLGNVVPHLHWHLLPRSADDPDRLKPVWLAIDQAERDSDVRRRLEATDRDRPETTAALRKALTRLGAPSS